MKKRTKLLYVDDDERTLTIVAKFLIANGYEVITSTSPFVAPLLQEEEPDLLILDLKMPLLAGDKIADILSRQGYADTIPIIFFSAVSTEKIERVTSRLPKASFVTKQSGLDELLSRIQSVLP